MLVQREPSESPIDQSIVPGQIYQTCPPLKLSILYSIISMLIFLTEINSQQLALVTLTYFIEINVITLSLLYSVRSRS